MSAPFLEFRQVSAPNGVITALALTGSGQNGAIVLGSTSAPVALRVYNNYSNVAGYGPAYNLTFASYDTDTTWGSSSTEPVIDGWLQLKVSDYDGVVTGADSGFIPLGGAAKHICPVHSAQIDGAAPHYVTFSVQVSVPLSATENSGSQGLWVEYTWT